MIRVGLRENRWRVFKTLIVCILLGPILGGLPVVAWATFVQVTEMNYSAQLNWWGLLEFPKYFFMSLLGAYMFEFAYGFVQSFIVGSVFSTVGVMAHGLPAWAIFFSTASALASGGAIYWRDLLCQCHPNAAGALFFEPVMFVIAHFFVGVGLLLVTRRIWSLRS